jgi:hypothetical protein
MLLRLLIITPKGLAFFGLLALASAFLWRI